MGRLGGVGGRGASSGGGGRWRSVGEWGGGLVGCWVGGGGGGGFGV